MDDDIDDDGSREEDVEDRSQEEEVEDDEEERLEEVQQTIYNNKSFRKKLLPFKINFRVRYFLVHISSLQAYDDRSTHRDLSCTLR